MIEAHDRDTLFGDLPKKVTAFIFLGVPHSGTDVAVWAKFAIDLSSTIKMGTEGNTNHLADLQANSETFSNIALKSIDRLQLDLIDIRTFYETDKIGKSIVC